MHWWQSIRWRLALGSMLVALAATGLLALSAMLAISYFYGADQQTQLTNFAADSAHHLGEQYTMSNERLVRAAIDAFSKRVTPAGTLNTPQGQEYLLLVLNNKNQFVYPVYKSALVNTLRNTVASALRARGTNGDIAVLHQALLAGHKGTATLSEIGSNRILSRPIMVEPVFSGGQQGGQQAGILVMEPRYAAENALPPFLSAVGVAVLIASIVIAVLAVLAAIIFSRTITRPLAILTRATQRMASGDLTTRVQTHTRDELGALSNNFNEMAAQLDRDVEELRKQELWRRELIMNITHDLATPLTAIAGLGESLADGVTQSREEYEETGQIIVRETLRLRRLVQDLHVMAKVEAGALLPQRHEVRLAALVDEVLAVLTPEFERASVEPRNAIPYTLFPVQADADMLTRVFTNLCDNAIRHTPPGGHVTLAARLLDKEEQSNLPQLLETSGQRAVQDTLGATSNTLLLSVTDTGEGIPPEALSRIFERFYRADSARQSARGGSGLGLAIVRAIVEAHGGTIWAENVPEGGARMLFTLPVRVVEKV
jgi:signal transduction histidine kinase